MKTETMKTEKTELEKARELLIKAEQESQEIFLKEYDELCKRHGYIIQAQTTLVINKL